MAMRRRRWLVDTVQASATAPASPNSTLATGGDNTGSTPTAEPVTVVGAGACCGGGGGKKICDGGGGSRTNGDGTSTGEKKSGAVN